MRECASALLIFYERIAALRERRDDYCSPRDRFIVIHQHVDYRCYAIQRRAALRQMRARRDDAARARVRKMRAEYGRTTRVMLQRAIRAMLSAMR